jgi:transcriptional regulator with XRE-family HTH domain
MTTGATFDQALARELHGQQVSCRQIAKQLGVAPSTISRWAEREGLVFDRAQVAAATRAHTIDLAAGRIRLAEKMLSATEDMLDTLDDPYVVYNFGGRDNTYEEHTFQDGAPVDVRKTVIQSAGVTFDRLTRIVEKSNPELESAEGILDMSAAMFEAAAERIRARRAEAAGDAPADA